MNKPFFLILFLIETGITFSQCPYHESVPDELNAGRLKDHEPSTWVQHPYTMFNKRKENWTFEADTHAIIQRIINSRLLNGVYIDDYAILYKCNTPYI